MNPKIFLVGLPGAGKTTIGMELAVELRVPFIDLDQEIEKNTKRSIRNIFQEDGEAAFRQLEFDQLRTTIAPVSYTHLRAHETKANLVCRLLLEKKKIT